MKEIQVSLTYVAFKEHVNFEIVELKAAIDGLKTKKIAVLKKYAEVQRESA